MINENVIGKMAIRLFASGMVTGVLAGIVMVVAIVTNNIQNIMLLSAIPTLLGSGITQAIIAVVLRIKAGNLSYGENVRNVHGREDFKNKRY